MTLSPTVAEHRRPVLPRSRVLTRAVDPTLPLQASSLLFVCTMRRSLADGEIEHCVLVATTGATIISEVLHAGGSAARETLATEQSIVSCPRVFSFLATPAETARAIAEFAGVIRDGHAKVTVDLSPIESVDLCAGTALMALATEGQGAGTEVTFLLPENRLILERLVTCGLSHVAKTDVPLPETALMPARRLVRDPVWTDDEGALASSAHLSALGDHVSKWLNRAGYPDVPPAVLKCVRQILTEIGVNISGHTHDGWWLCAALSEERERSTALQIVAFNLGSTIHDTMERIPKDSWTLKELALLREEHESRGSFDEYFSPEDLVLLYALQDDVSSLGIETRRGAGTFRIATEFASITQGIRAGSARMALVSGTTRVLFDGHYGPTPSRLPSRQGSLDLSFNHFHDLRIPPDRRVFHTLGAKFPGTLFILEIGISSDALLLTVQEAI
jgi:microcompartment protein CcmK/EutM